jgi:hypothetical protein
MDQMICALITKPNNNAAWDRGTGAEENPTSRVDIAFKVKP